MNGGKKLDAVYTSSTLLTHVQAMRMHTRTHVRTHTHPYTPHMRTHHTCIHTITQALPVFLFYVRTLLLSRKPMTCVCNQEWAKKHICITRGIAYIKQYILLKQFSIH